MRILLIGATGTLGQAIFAALAPRHEVLRASRTRAPLHVDLAAPASIRDLYAAAGPLDAVICAAGRSRRGALPALVDDDYAFSFANKLMGQVNLVRFGLDHVADGGSFTLTSGMIAHRPEAGSVTVAMMNGAIESFARAAALDLPRGLRVNAVSPPWIRETLVARAMDTAGAMTAADAARWYVRSVEGDESGRVFGVDADTNASTGAERPTPQ